MVNLKFIFPVFLCMSLMLTGCNQAVKETFTPVYVPTYIVPKPPTVTRPDIYLNTMTDAQKEDIGELSKGYAITAKQFKQYACLLEKVVDKYAELASAPPSTTAPVITLSADEQQECSTK